MTKATKLKQHQHSRLLAVLQTPCGFFHIPYSKHQFFKTSITNSLFSNRINIIHIVSPSSYFHILEKYLNAQIIHKFIIIIISSKCKYTQFQFHMYIYFYIQWKLITHLLLIKHFLWGGKQSVMLYGFSIQLGRYHCCINVSINVNV